MDLFLYYMQMKEIRKCLDIIPLKDWRELHHFGISIVVLHELVYLVRQYTNLFCSGIT